MERHEFAPDRGEGHQSDPTQRALSDGYDEVGLAGEFAFGEWCGLWPDVSGGSDEGWDFLLYLEFSVHLQYTADVKTARHPKWLLIPEGKKKRADIYVLAGYDDDTKKAHLVGWEWARTVFEAPVDTFGTHKIRNHFIPADKLRPMSQLKCRLLDLRGRKT